MQPPDMPKAIETPSGAPAAYEFQVDTARIAQDLQLRKIQVDHVVQLLDQENTVPFIVRYRKERTGGLDEEMVRQIQDRVKFQRQLAERKQTVLKSIAGQGKLTAELEAAILACESTKRLEDLYLPFKPKKRSRGMIAREKGLDGLAQAVWGRDPAVANLAEVLPGMVNPEKQLNSVEEVLAGVADILADQFAETADVRAAVRKLLWETGKITTARAEGLPEGRGLEYRDYFKFTDGARTIPAHRILAINRGERERALTVRIEADLEAIRRVACEKLALADHPHAEFLKKVLDDSLERLLLPSLHREIRRELGDEAEEHAIQIFARNLRALFLQPPLRQRRILAIDPGFHSGCKIAVLDEVGKLLEHTVVHPFARPERPRAKPAERPTQPQAVAPVALENAPTVSCALPGSAGQLSVDAAQATTSGEALQPSPSPVIEPLSGVRAEPQDAPEEKPPVAATSSAAEGITLMPEAAVPLAAVDTATAGLASLPEMPESTSSGQPVEEGPQSQPGEAVGVAPTAPQAAPVEPPPTPPRIAAKEKLEKLIRKHQVQVIAIGNGTAGRETEEVISELLQEAFPELAYVVVNEAGASVYSTSALAREEFPRLDATIRGTVSIGRRLQDPMSELVKVDPQHVGVGMYQHDLNLRRLKERLEAVVESCVNSVGVELNTASAPLLRHVSGLNQLLAHEVVRHLKQHGPFKNRMQLQQIPGIGPNRFTQAAGFLRILDGDQPLDATWVHPESYPAAEQLLGDLGVGPEVLRDRQKTEELREKLKVINIEEVSARLGIGIPTLRDICDALARPGRDPREDLPPPVFKKGVLKLEDLQPGMELRGTVSNVVDFGAFVDVGLKDSGLVHISQMANRYVGSPHDLVTVGDVVNVWVLNVDQERHRVSLTMLRPRPPGTAQPRRRGPEGSQRDAQQQPRSQRPPRGHKPAQSASSQPAQQPQAVQASAGESVEPAAPAAAAPRHGRPRPPQHQHQPQHRQHHHQHQRQRKPHRNPPKPRLSQEALEGEAPLRTFGELKAFFDAQRTPPKEEKPVETPPTSPTEETPKPPE